MKRGTLFVVFGWQVLENVTKKKKVTILMCFVIVENLGDNT